jgi:preprotein translocase subunit YajC
VVNQVLIVVEMTAMIVMRRRELKRRNQKKRENLLRSLKKPHLHPLRELLRYYVR